MAKTFKGRVRDFFVLHLQTCKVVFFARRGTEMELNGRSSIKREMA